MANLKVVSVFSTELPNSNIYKNSFIHNRNRYGQIIKLKKRCQSAPFFSCLEPVNIFTSSNCGDYENEALPAKCRSGIIRKDSMTNKTFSREISSAVDLMYNRSNKDLVNNQTALNATKTTAKSTTPIRWKSAGPRLTTNSDLDNSRKVIYLKAISEDIKKVSLPGTRLSSDDDNAIRPESLSPECQKNLLTSKSNTISHFVTIDDVENARKKWNDDTPINRRADLNIPINDFKTVGSKLKIQVDDIDGDTVEYCEKSSASRFDRRNELLREFMNVYMDWRHSSKRIHERPRSCRSMNTGGPGPHQQINNFHQLIRDKKKTLEARSAQRMNNRSRNDYQLRPPNLSSAQEYDRLGGSIINKTSLVQVLEEESEESKDSTKDKLNKFSYTSGTIKAEENSNTDEDEVSEIDWLESNDDDDLL